MWERHLIRIPATNAMPPATHGEKKVPSMIVIMGKYNVYKALSSINYRY